MKKILTISFPFLAALLLPVFSSAQSANFIYFGTEQGLPQSGIQKILQDKEGNLWMGTMAGAARYNGSQFRNFTKKDGLAENWVTSMCMDRKGNIWLGHWAGGISVYDASSEKFRVFTVPGVTIYKTISSIMEDSSGTIWFGTEGSGVARYIPDSTGRSAASPGSFSLISQKDGLSGNNIYDIVQGRSGEVWFATENGITKYFQHSFQHFGIKDGVPGGEVTALFSDKSNMLWIGTRDSGAFKYDPETQKTIKRLSQRNGLYSNHIKVIYEDRDDNLWFGTYGGGVAKYTPSYEGNSILRNPVRVFGVNEGLSNNKVLSILEDREDNIWIGTYIGLNQYRAEIFETYSMQEGLKSSLIWSLTQDRNKNLWIGTEAGLVKYSQDGEKKGKAFTVFNNTKNEDNVTAVYEDIDGFIWYSVWGSGVRRMNPLSGKTETFNTQNGLPSNNIYSINSDMSEDIWFATDKNGVCKYNLRSSTYQYYTSAEGLGSNRVYTIFKDSRNNLWFGTLGGYISVFDGKGFHTFNEKEGLMHSFVLCITEDKKGNIWMGTYGGGLYKYDGRMFKNYDITDGMNSDTPYLLVCDNDNNIWIGTSIGIDKFNPDKGSFTHYGKEEGFLGIEVNPNAICKDVSGNLWFGTIAGLVKYDPRKDRINTIEPLTRFTSLKILYKDTRMNPGTSFNYDQNHLTFDYIGISLTNPKNVRYQYMLEGLDKTWSPGTQVHSVTYPNIPPGKYSFLVRACNNDGIWNSRPVSYSFVIIPPIWKRSWFYFVAALILISSVYGLIQLRTRSIKKEKRILEARVKERTEEIAQKNMELEKLSIVASETDNAVFIASPDGVIEWVNAGFTKLSGYSFEDFKKIKGATLTEASNNPDLAEAIHRSVKERKSITYETINTHRDGRKFWAQSTLTPIFSESGKLTKLVVIDADITELKEAEYQIKQKNKDITDSIVYAKRIQEAILPGRGDIAKGFSDFFIYYRPRDIVSGDFYWFAKQFGKVLIASVDCTGHGVPGAFMSMIGNDMLNQIVKVKGIIEPAAVLNSLNESIRHALKQDKKESETSDGMDIALCLFDKSSNRLEYAGAHRPLYLIRNKQLQVINADKFPIGGTHIDSDKKFTNHVIEVKKGDMIYLFSDGYTDQFGGEGGRKFMAKHFQRFLAEIHELSMSEQERALSLTFEKWKGSAEQVDDVLVVGFRV